MILDSASLREILRVRSGHAVRHLANAVAMVAVGALTLLAPGHSGAQTLLDLQSQIESATQALQNGGASNIDPKDGTADTSLDPEAGDRSEEADEETKRRNATDE